VCRNWQPESGTGRHAPGRSRLKRMVVLGMPPQRAADIRFGRRSEVPPERQGSRRLRGRTPLHTAECAEGGSRLEDTVDLDVFTPPREDWIAKTDAYLRCGSSPRIHSIQHSAAEPQPKVALPRVSGQRSAPLPFKERTLTHLEPYAWRNSSPPANILTVSSTENRATRSAPLAAGAPASRPSGCPQLRPSAQGPESWQIEPGRSVPAPAPSCLARPE
jgi:hypothetical protein